MENYIRKKTVNVVISVVSVFMYAVICKEEKYVPNGELVCTVPLNVKSYGQDVTQTYVVITEFNCNYLFTISLTNRCQLFVVSWAQFY
jgi:hypothetical protein